MLGILGKNVLTADINTLYASCQKKVKLGKICCCLNESSARGESLAKEMIGWYKKYVI